MDGFVSPVGTVLELPIMNKRQHKILNSTQLGVKLLSSRNLCYILSSDIWLLCTEMWCLMSVSSSLLRKHSPIFQCLTTRDALSSEPSTWCLKSWREIEPPLWRLLAMDQLGWYHSRLWHHFSEANVPIRLLPQVTLQKKNLIILMGRATS